jgi:hypothetical protein
MIEIKCPACGAEGRAPKGKVQARLICKKCLKIFHITPSGKTVLGEPPATGQTSTAAAHDPAAIDRTQEVDQWFERVSKRLFSPSSLILGVGLIVLAMVVSFLSFRHQETLQDRVTKVATAAVQGDLQTIRDLAATGTANDAVSWYDSIRPQCDQMRQSLGPRKLVIQTQVTQQDSGQGSAEVVAQLTSEEQFERKGNTLPDASVITTPSMETITLPMAWKSEGWSGWRLDGKRTLENSKAQP